VNRHTVPLALLIVSPMDDKELTFRLTNDLDR
jgi:hypothetical protein